MSPAERLRRAIPLGLVPTLSRARAKRAMKDPETRDRARAHMDLLLGASGSTRDLDEVAMAFCAFYLSRPEIHRHPASLHHQRVHGVEHLTAAKALGRGVVLHFLHHGFYEGAVSSLAIAGHVDHAIVEPDLVTGTLTGSRAAYKEAIGRVDLKSTDIGLDGMVDLVRSGKVVAMATDRPGRTPVEFCGRALWSSSGAVRIAEMTGAPVVALTSEQTPSGETVGRLHPAADPADFESAEALLQHLVSIHEPTVLAWPEAYVFPLDCWGTEAPAPRKPR